MFGVGRDELNLLLDGSISFGGEKTLVLKLDIFSSCPLLM